MIKWGGTRYRLHPLFVLLMVSSVFTGYLTEMLTLFGVVAIHELGHVACAKHFGWRVREVQLLPFGGVAEVEESGSVPAREELLVALFGPLQNVWMAGFAWTMRSLELGDESYWSYFLTSNLLIGLFNLMPALPLDGGKVLQALLSYVLPYHRTLSFMTLLSLLLSLMLVLASVIRYPEGGIHLNLLIIGVFLFVSNWYGYKHLQYQFMRFLVHRERHSARMLEEGRLPQPLLVRSDAPPMEIFRRFMRECPHLLYVAGRTGRVDRVVPEQPFVRAYLHRLRRPGETSERRAPPPPPRQRPKIG